MSSTRYYDSQPQREQSYTSPPQDVHRPEKHVHYTEHEVHPEQEAQQEAQFEAQFLRHATSWIPQAPSEPYPQSLTLRQPIVIPRVNIGNMIEMKFPFMRASSSALEPFNIYQQDFVAFIDNLNVAQAPPAPLQALNAAGMAIGFVPHHWAILAGIGMNVAAGAGTAAVSAIRTKSFLEKVNTEYFAPRGLKASIYKNEDLCNKLGYSGTLPETTDNSQAMTLGMRQVNALGRYIAPLDFNVPLPSEATNALDKMTQKQMAWRMKKLDKKAQKQNDKRARLAAEQKQAALESAAYHDTVDGYGLPSSYGGGSAESQKMEEKRLKELEKMEKRRGKEEVKANKRIGKMEYTVIEML